MNIFHVSPIEITKIEKNMDIFGNCFFFCADEPSYHMGGTIAYKMECKEDDFIDVCYLKSQDSIDEIIYECEECELEIDKDTAKDFLQNRIEITSHLGEDYDYDLHGNLDRIFQRIQGETAKEMGYLGCESEDENGHMYIVPMFGKENLLIQE